MNTKRYKMKTKDLILCSMFTALIAIGAFIRIPVPPVPFTLQFLFTMLAGLLLGGRNGAISVLMYIVLGLIGVPIFTGGGGIGYILKPTFGYIIGFMVGAYFTGKLANKDKSPSIKRLLYANFTGLFIVYAFGLVYFYGISHLYLGTNIGVGSLLFSGFILCAPGDIFFCIMCAIVGKRLIPLIRNNI